MEKWMERKKGWKLRKDRMTSRWKEGKKGRMDGRLDKKEGVRKKQKRNKGRREGREVNEGRQRKD